jgi:hypothetical protein
MLRRAKSGIVAVAFILGIVQGLWASETIQALAVGIDPARPTIRTPIALSAWASFPDPGQQFVEASYTISGRQVDVTIVMQDLHSPGSVWPLIMTEGGGSVDLGTLRAGKYRVNVVMLMIPWYGGTPTEYAEGSMSFKVTGGPK